MILLVASNKDAASLNIAKQILSHYAFSQMTETFQESPVHEANLYGKKARLVTLREESIHAQNLTGFFSNLELIIFISRHSSESGTPTLSVHTPGNFGEAKFGGIPERVSISPANAMRNALKTMMRLKQELRLDYEVSYECTHHGPSLDVPTMFAELGSSPKQWNDPKAAEVVARAALEAISSLHNPPVKAVLGIGGPHYNNKFTRLAIEKNMAFGHIIPKHAVAGANPKVLRHCIERTMEKVESVILDWKGVRGEDKLPLIETLTEIGIVFEKT